MFKFLPRTAGLWLLMAGIVIGAFISAALAENKPIADQDLAAWVDQRVKEWQIKSAERPFDAIGWVTDIREAEGLAREHQRPVFLFTHDGRMGIGRC